MKKGTTIHASRREPSSEEKIKEAARRVFTKKGYAATRTRDIAAEAGMNPALLNYYFRSKEKLFQVVMMEQFQSLFGAIVEIFMGEETSLKEKMSLLASKYFEILTANPDMPLFVLSEIRQHPDKFRRKLHLDKLIGRSSLVKQLQKERPDVEPLQYLMNFMGLAVFPFIARPVLFGSPVADPGRFDTLVAERREFIPKWMKAMMAAK